MKSVLILQRRLPRYRLALFESLRDRLAAEGVDLTLAIGELSPDELSRQDEGHLPWAVKIPTRYFSISQKRAVWLKMPPDLAANHDLLILTHENNLLSNLPLLLNRSNKGPLIAFWGHGANFQSRQVGGPANWLRNWTARKADWWFAYTQRSVEKLVACDVPAARITCLDNAIDTSELRRWQEETTLVERADILSELSLRGEAVGIALGSLHGHRRLQFLFAAADEIRRRLPTFELIVIGDGPLRDELHAWASGKGWVRWVGARHGRDMVRHASLGHVLLNPGMVGLNILDGFALGLPMVTTNCGIHSPEIAYLEAGVNGMMTADSVDGYASAVVRMLGDPDERARMAAACRVSAQRYTLEAMVDNFAEGIRQTLKATRR